MNYAPYNTVLSNSMIETNIEASDIIQCKESTSEICDCVDGQICFHHPEYYTCNCVNPIEYCQFINGKCQCYDSFSQKSYPMNATNCINTSPLNLNISFTQEQIIQIAKGTKARGDISSSFYKLYIKNPQKAIDILIKLVINQQISISITLFTQILQEGGIPQVFRILLKIIHKNPGVTIALLSNFGCVNEIKQTKLYENPKILKKFLKDIATIDQINSYTQLSLLSNGIPSKIGIFLYLAKNNLNLTLKLIEHMIQNNQSILIDIFGRLAKDDPQLTIFLLKNVRINNSN
jgi:hypothetical protein